MLLSIGTNINLYNTVSKPYLECEEDSPITRAVLE